MSSRTVFVLKEGILRRGVAIGVVVTAVYVVTNLRNEDFFASPARATGLIVLCFLEWGIGAGWIIGEFLWARMARRQKRVEARGTRADSLERDDQRRRGHH